MVDRQYGYMFDLNKLYNKSGDYHVSVAADVTIVLNVCNKLVNKSACKGSGRGLGACITKGQLYKECKRKLSFYNQS